MAFLKTGHPDHGSRCKLLSYNRRAIAQRCFRPVSSRFARRGWKSCRWKTYRVGRQGMGRPMSKEVRLRTTQVLAEEAEGVHFGSGQCGREAGVPGEPGVEASFRRN